MGTQWLARLRRAWVAFLVVAVIAAIIVFSGSHRAFLLGILIFIFALMASVMLHELGHFLTAKKFGMRVTQFFLGFGATLWSTFRGETEYGVKALWLGGFVKITGMTSVEEVDVADEPRSFRNQPGWQRIIVLAAGSFMHFVLALFLLFVLALGIGLSTETNLVSSLIPCVPVSSAALNSAAPCHGATVHSSPAQAAGLRPNDRIITVGGKAVDSFTQLQTVMKSERAGVPLPLLVLRNGHEVHLTVTPAAVPHEASPFLGVESLVTYQGTGVWGAVTFAGSQFGDTITSSVSAIGKLPAAIPDLFAKDRASTPAGQVSSVVGVGDVTGDVVEASLPWQAKATLILYLVASLNIFVGLFNLLPLLPLDGGHLAVVIFERIRAWFANLRGRPDPGLVDIQKLVPVSLLVFAVLVGFGTLLIAADIFNPVHIQV
ncbi:MAG TPA: site-2 protease family protein [Streptosporangiaceae bacterium]|jgi:membrane-associated protease RseP (regulator of RpoE activity)|nr:site-2 protease family protein [Streptosporangiaceae bacterium]